MAWFDPELKFNIKKINAMKKMCESKKEEIDSVFSGSGGSETGIKGSMEELKNSWKTPAGEKFFNDVSSDLTEMIQKYSTVTECIIELLQEAESQYGPVEENAEKLSL